MEQFKFNTKFDIGDQVYHATKDSDMGIITDSCYFVRSGTLKYEVAFGRLSGDSVWCYEEEISEVKTY